MPSLTGGEMPRKMARVIKSVIEVNIRSRNSKSRTINSLLGCKETKKRTNSTMEKEMEESFGLSKKDTKTKTEIQPFWFLKPKPGFGCTLALREY